MQELNFKEFTAQRNVRGLRLIDVREPEEYNTFHVHGAENFPLSRLEKGEFPEEDDRNIALISGVGTRSALAAQMLEDAGFEETVNISDGTRAAVNNSAGGPSSLAAT